MAAAKQIPKEKGLDSTLEVLKEGYQFIPNRLKMLQSNIFETRLLGKRAIVISGEDAAKLFYDDNKMTRLDVVPKRIQKSLFGVGGVQSLDGAKHHHRKRLFMSLMTKERISELLEIADHQLELCLQRWMGKDFIPFFEEAEKLLFRIVCQWAGVPLWAKELNKRARDMGAMVDALGAVGKRYSQGRKARKRSEIWLESLVEQVRSGKLLVHKETALYQFTWYKEQNGELLHPRVAAVELLNILRPTVAIARFLTFGVVALHEYPEERIKFERNEGDYRRRFVQEVRRFYPFGPFLGAKARFNFDWEGYPFQKGTLVILDICGTNHNEEIWSQPEQFNPARFKDWKESPFSFIPQGGGDYDFGHRCAGEEITVELMIKCLGFLTDHVTYSLPPQNLNYEMKHIPSIPKSKVIIENVQRK